MVDAVRMTEEGNKLMSMGILPGSLLEVVRRDPWGTTYYLKVDGQAIALRKQELATIEMTLA